MLKRFQFTPSRLSRWLMMQFLFFVIIMSVYRLVFFTFFHPSDTSFSESLFSFWLGMRFDARVIAIILLPVLLLGSFKVLNPFLEPLAKKTWRVYLGVAAFCMIIFFGLDYYYYSYLTQRLNGNILNFVEDAGISLNMMWQSYPLLRLTLMVILFLFIMVLISRKLFKTASVTYFINRRSRIISFLIVFLFFSFLIYGKAGRFPLRWSDAFSLGNQYESNLALNPFQSFFSSLNFRHAEYDIKKVKEYYPLMSQYLGVDKPDATQLDFTRNFAATDSINEKPNVVLVICESFSAYKSSMWNNPLNTTPFFDSLSKEGLFFDHAFTPHFGTARGVWATITGIPDVQLVKTASRNPQAVDQRTIINDFKGYEKFYFLGGNASWANIRGVITNNIEDVKLFEEDDYSAPSIDVWGISDLNLFMEANKVLSKQQKPFFAIIQTSDNHRPYTIPEADRGGFEIINNVSIDTLKKYGFESADEYNAFRYTDYCFSRFMKTAQKEKYGANTLFVFVGDHGIRCKNPLPLFPKSWVDQGLACEHVPLLFYYPNKLQPQRVSTIASQVDILPTIAGMVNISYTNTGMGKDLTTNLAADNYAFIIDHDTRQVGVVYKGFYYTKSISNAKEEFVSIVNDAPIPDNTYTDSLRKNMRQMTDAYFQTAKYLLLNNKSH